MTGIVLLVALLQGSAPASSIVQVAVNYGPRQDGFASGIITGDGRTVLTDAGILPKAREISIAFSDGEISDVILARVQQQNQVAMLPMVDQHGQVAVLSPLAANPAPDVEVAAIAGGQPQAFLVERRNVRARPVGIGAALRWEITPAPPAFVRGGPLLDTQGRLIAVIVKEGDTLVGMPLLDLYAKADVSAAASKETPAASANADGTNVASFLKDAALPPIQVRVPEIAKPAPSQTPAPVAPSGRTTVAVVKPPDSASPSLPALTALPAPHSAEPPPPRGALVSLPLRASRLGWATKEVAPPPVVVAATSSADALRLAKDLVDKKDFVKAVDVLEAAVQKNPAAGDLYFQMGFAYWYKSIFKPDGKRRVNVEKSSYHKAIKAFETFIAKAPRDDIRVPDAQARIKQLRSAQWGYVSR